MQKRKNPKQTTTTTKYKTPRKKVKTPNKKEANKPEEKNP